MMQGKMVEPATTSFAALSAGEWMEGNVPAVSVNVRPCRLCHSHGHVLETKVRSRGIRNNRNPTAFSTTLYALSLTKPRLSRDIIDSTDELRFPVILHDNEQ